MSYNTLHIDYKSKLKQVIEDRRQLLKEEKEKHSNQPVANDGVNNSIYQDDNVDSSSTKKKTKLKSNLNLVRI